MTDAPAPTPAPAPARFSTTVFARDTAPVRDAYARLFDLEVTADIGWFVSLRRPGADWEVCVWDPDHEGVPAAARETAAAGVGALLAFVVDDVDALHAQATAADLLDLGVTVLAEPVDEPWGQRHVFLRDPAGTIVDVVQITTPDPAWLEAHGIDPASVPAPSPA